MIIRFKATEFGAEDDGYALICGASNSKSEDDHHYITLQRSSDPTDEDDWGVHFEIDDQINGGYDLLRSCKCSPNLLVCRLRKGVSWYPELTTVEVTLPKSQNNYSELVGILSRIFHDRKKDIKIDAEQVS